MTPGQAIGAYAALIVGGIALTAWIVHRDMRRMVEEFERLFPGECLICSYHRYGVMEGHEDGPVAPHNCCNPPRKKP
jgi:hypothetical protein